MVRRAFMVRGAWGQVVAQTERSGRVMKAPCWHGKHDIRVETVPDPKVVNPRGAIVRVTSTAICGSDVQPAGWMLSMIGVILIAVNRSRPKRCAIAVGKAQRVMRAIPTTSVELPLGSHGRSRG